MRIHPQRFFLYFIAEYDVDQTTCTNLSLPLIEVKGRYLEETVGKKKQRIINI